MLTGEKRCSECGARVLVVRTIDTGKIVTLDAERTDGGWYPEAVNANVLVASYHAPGAFKRNRDGHHAHSLRCQQRQVEQSASLQQSRDRIDAGMQEQDRAWRVMDFLPIHSTRSVLPIVGDYA